MIEQRLQLRCDCDNFAPSVESAKIELDLSVVQGLVTGYVLEVRNWRGEILHRRDFVVEDAPPSYLFWDGRLGDDGRFVSPLDAPLVLRVIAFVDETAEGKMPTRPTLPQERPKSVIPCWQQFCEDFLPGRVAARSFGDTTTRPWAETATVHVLYHSLEIRRGPWLATEAVPDRGSDGWLALRLNELGYFAGPAGARYSPAHLSRARRHFERNNRRPPRELELDCFSIEDALEAEDVERLPGFQRPRPFANPKDPFDVHYESVPDGSTLRREDDEDVLRAYVEALPYRSDLQSDVNELRDQYERGKSKLDADRAVLNRPNIPLEAVIYLRGKAGQRILAPYAVGPVRVDWIAEEPPEDLDRLPQDRPRESGHARRYITAVHEQTRESSRNNCPERFGGARTGSDSAWHDAFWTFPSSSYEPYEIDCDYSHRRVYVRAHTKATPARCVGKAGVLFHPSFIAGDRYELRAEISFIDHPNRSALEGVHGPLAFVSSPIEVWRSAKVAMVVGWPPRELSTQDWRRVRSEYAHCYLDLDLASIDRVRIEDILSDEEFGRWVTWCADTSNHVETLERALVCDRLHPRGLIAPSRSFEDGEHHGMVVSAFISSKLFSSPPSTGSGPKPIGGLNVICATLLRNIRRRRPRGIAIIDYDPLGAFRPEQLRDWDDFCKSVTAPANGMEDGLVFINRAMNVRTSYIYTHEIAHCLWLRHHENAGERDDQLAQDHDQADHDCMMSYPTDSEEVLSQRPHQTWAGYDPRFCGKCNLKLRGWAVRDGLPASSC